MTPLAVLFGKLKIAASYFFLFLFVLFCIYASLNTITLFLWGDPSVHSEPRLFHPPEIMVLHYVGMISPELARVIVALLFWGIGFFAWFNFRHTTKKTSLDHPLRERILSFICSHPGCHFGSVLRELSINRGTLSYHLDQLTGFGYIQNVADGGLTRYYSNAREISGPELALQKHRDNPVRNRILNELEGTATMLATELKKNLKITSSPALFYHMQLLVRDGLVLRKQEGNRAGRPVSYSLVPAAKEMICASQRADGIPPYATRFHEQDLISGDETEVRA
jgi:predicted transcriptional regulator